MNYCPLISEHASETDIRRRNHQSQLWSSAQWFALNDWHISIELCYISEPKSQTIRCFLLLYDQHNLSPDSKKEFLDSFERVLPDDYGWKRFYGNNGQTEFADRKFFFDQIISNTQYPKWYSIKLNRRFELFDIAPKLLQMNMRLPTQFTNNSDKTISNSDKTTSNSEQISNQNTDELNDKFDNEQKQFPFLNSSRFYKQLRKNPITIPYHPLISDASVNMSVLFREMLYSAPSMITLSLIPLTFEPQPPKILPHSSDNITLSDNNTQSETSLTINELLKRNHELASFIRRILIPYHSLMNLDNSVPYSEVERFYTTFVRSQSELSKFQIDVVSTDYSRTQSLALAWTAPFGGSRVFNMSKPSAGFFCNITDSELLNETINYLNTLNVKTDDSSDLLDKSQNRSHNINYKYLINSKYLQNWIFLLKYAPSIVSREESTSLLRLPFGDEQGLPGIDVRQPPPFATSTISLLHEDDVQTGYIKLGQLKTSKVIDSNNTSYQQYYHAIPLKQLCKHALIVGSTGSGKTTAIQYLLKQIAQANIPFLVIEPSMKAEYYDALKNQTDIKNLTRLTLGENFCFDPMRLPDNITVQQHVSYLKSCFESAFSFNEWGISLIETGLYSYYQSIYKKETYTLKGNKEHVKKGIKNKDREDTLYDHGETLLYKEGEDTLFVAPSFNHFTTYFVEKFLPTLFPHLQNQSPQSTPASDDIGEIFKRHFTAMKKGPLGRLFQIADLQAFSNPIKYGRMFPSYLPFSGILELNQLPDRQHQALIMSFIMTLLFEHRQNEGIIKNNETLPRHVLVIEEAHRLLGTNTPARNNEIAGENPRTKAASMFSDMLAEIRAFGQSVIIAEQIPSKIIPDAVKNTNLKYLMRLTTAEDREFIGRSMNCSEQQQKFVNTLKPFQTIVFEEELNQPILLNIPTTFKN
jgi:hypothetical protein